ncbi:hypothetical protein SFRURICE_003710 [Spodoptera frugiperda]|nr:hypothetical protein SFRURICE_003710 [Spodoptera frugiperda]
MRCMDHSCWQSGHRLFCFTHKDMQQKWKLWLHSPHTTTQSCLPYESFLLSPWQRRQASVEKNTAQISQINIFFIKIYLKIKKTDETRRFIFSTLSNILNLNNYNLDVVPNTG